MTLFPKASGEFIMKYAKNVSYKTEGIDKLSQLIMQDLKTEKLNPRNFSQNDIHPKKSDPWAVNWIFVVDTLNFCFWTPGFANSTKYRVDRQTGYFALCAAINRAMKENIDILNPKFFSKITFEELQHIMRSDDSVTQVPLLAERVECLHQVGKILLEKYDGMFTNCIKAAEKSAQTLLKIITEDFECFRDEAVYNGQRVAIYKRAQILIGDIWACFHGKDLGEFNDIDTITMFADYRVPQVLIHFGAMAYSNELYERLNRDELMPNGCSDEVEIRGASIFICELIKDKIRQLICDENNSTAEKLNISEKDINGILIDHFLWDYRRQHAAELEYIPFHKVLCMYY